MPEETSNLFDRWRSATLAPFHTRVFAVFWCASVVSSFGSLIQTVGASWLMATIDPSADRVALVQTAGTLPFFFLSLIAGALADTYDRRIIMIVAQSLMLLASIVLAVIALISQVTPNILLAVTFIIGCGTASFAPAWQASIGDQVPRTQIAASVAANALGFNLARSIGPAIGGVIVALAGAAAAFVINAISYIGILGALLWWRPVPVANPLPPEPLFSAIAAGVRYVRLSPDLMAILFRSVMFTVPMAAVPSLMPIVARDLLEGGAQTYGFLLGSFGVGAMLGALASAALRTRFSSDILLRALCAFAFIALLVISQSHWVWLTLLAHILAGCLWTLGLANFNIAMQLSSPRWVTGRTLALYQTFAFAGLALGSWIWGHFAVAFNVREAFLIAGFVALLTFVFAHWLPVSVARMGSLDPQVMKDVAPSKVVLDPASGPIVITIEYRVLVQHASQFMSAINELGRIRRRDGARRWSVCQDLDAPEQWVERYESPTWLDYLRRQTRSTMGDQVVRQQLVGLIQSERGSVRRMLERPAGSEPIVGVDTLEVYSL